jgi:cellulase/cellobiase CelA1
MSGACQLDPSTASSAVREPYVSPANQAILSGKFYEWNRVFDEQTFVQKLAAGFSAAGITGLGFIV